MQEPHQTPTTTGNALRDDITAETRENTYAPREDPEHANTWYHTARTELAPVLGGRFKRPARSVKTRIELTRSNEYRKWYCAQLVATYYHNPIDSASDTGESEEERVYRPRVYVTYYPIKPVRERLNAPKGGGVYEKPFDVKGVERETYLCGEDSLLPRELQGFVRRAKHDLVERAEAIGDRDREAKIKEGRYLWNADTGRYEIPGDDAQETLVAYND